MNIDYLFINEDEKGHTNEGLSARVKGLGFRV